MKVTDVEVLENAEEAYWLRSTFSGVETRMLVLSNGSILRQEGALGMSIVRMDKASAMNIPASDASPVDIIALRTGISRASAAVMSRQSPLCFPG